MSPVVKASWLFSGPPFSGMLRGPGRWFAMYAPHVRAAIGNELHSEDDHKPKDRSLPQG